MYCLVYYPHINITAINTVRSKFDPTISLIDPHITVVFPFAETTPEEEVARHIESVLHHWTPFEVRLHGFEKSWDHWLFLSVAEGKAEFMRLHDELYTGLLAPYLWKAIPYAPHIGLGLFVQKDSQYDLKHPQQVAFDEEHYHQALHEAQALQLDYTSRVDQLTLIKLNEDFTHILSSRDFPLPAPSS
jgi:2'-5' RNA ligase